MGTKSDYLKIKVRAVFLTGRKLTAKELNQEVGFNDARKVISTLRKEGWSISDIRLEDGCKLYWLDSPSKQLSLFGDLDPE